MPENRTTSSSDKQLNDFAWNDFNPLKLSNYLIISRTLIGDLIQPTAGAKAAGELIGRPSTAVTHVLYNMSYPKSCVLTRKLAGYNFFFFGEQ